MEEEIRNLFRSWGVPDHIWNYNPSRIEPNTLNLKYVKDSGKWVYYYVEPNGVISTEIMFDVEKTAVDHFIEEMRSNMKYR